MRPSRAINLALLTAAACRAPAPPAVVAIVAPDAAPSAAIEIVDAGPPLPPDVTDVTAIVKPSSRCTVSGSAWESSGARPWSLAVSAEGPVFAALRAARGAELSLSTDGAFFGADTGSAHVAGITKLAEVRVGVTHPVVFAGFLVPSVSEADLRITRVDGDRVTLATEAPEGVDLAAGTALAADVACAELSLVGSSADLTTTLGDVRVVRQAIFAQKRAIPLSVSSGGPRVADVRFDGEHAVAVLEEKAGRARVRFRAGDALAFGWVRSTDVRPTPKMDSHRLRQAALAEAAEFGMIGLLSSGPSVDDDAGAPARLACPHSARVIAELNGRRYAVGALAPNAPFVPDGRGEIVTRIATPGSIALESGVKLVVPTRDLVGCGASTAEEAADPQPSPFGGFGGLGLSGIGEGGSGRGEGIGLGTVGARDGGAPGAGAKLHQGALTVSGRLPPEVIQRIVRQNFGRFRLCYEAGLRKRSDLAGRVSIRFVIEKSGATASVADAGSTLPDRDVVACVSRAFGNLSFPQPEGGTVTVVFPIEFSPD